MRKQQREDRPDDDRPGDAGHERAGKPLRDVALRFPEIRLMYTSGYTEDGAARRELLQDGTIFLEKPYTVADLARAVRRALFARPQAVTAFPAWPSRKVQVRQQLCAEGLHVESGVSDAVVIPDRGQRVTARNRRECSSGPGPASWPENRADRGFRGPAGRPFLFRPSSAARNPHDQCQLAVRAAADIYGSVVADRGPTMTAPRWPAAARARSSIHPIRDRASRQCNLQSSAPYTTRPRRRDPAGERIFLRRSQPAGTRSRTLGQAAEAVRRKAEDHHQCGTADRQYQKPQYAYDGSSCLRSHGESL